MGRYSIVVFLVLSLSSVVCFAHYGAGGVGYYDGTPAAGDNDRNKEVESTQKTDRDGTSSDSKK